jgi:cold shock CspA family protein
MGRLIGTVGFFDDANGRGVIHPDYDFQKVGGINLPVTKEGLEQSGLSTLDAGLRVTCLATTGQEQSGMQAFDIKEYHGNGLNG